MSPDVAQDKLEAMKQIEGGPGVEDVLDAYGGSSGYETQRAQSQGQFSGPDQISTYTNTSE